MLKIASLVALLALPACAHGISAQPCGRVKTSNELWVLGFSIRNGNGDTNFTRCRDGISNDHLNPPLPFQTEPND